MFSNGIMTHFPKTHSHAHTHTPGRLTVLQEISSKVSCHIEVTARHTVTQIKPLSAHLGFFQRLEELICDCKGPDFCGELLKVQ